MAGRPTDLLVVVCAGAASLAVDLGVLHPYLGVGGVARAGAAQELLDFGAQGGARLPVAVSEVLHDRSHQDLQDLHTDIYHLDRKSTRLNSSH